jgi:hypothetical protein
MEVMAWRGGRNPGAFEEETLEEAETVEPRQTIPSGAGPVARAVLLVKYTPPADWNHVSVHELARDFGLAGPGEEQFVELVMARSKRLELALLRRDACFEKREYLRAMKERTVEGLRKALVREGHSRDQVCQRIDLLEKQAVAGEVLLGEVRAVQKDRSCPVDSQAYLAARFQELTLWEEKMSRYTAHYEAEWEDRFTLTSQEWKTLAEIFATTPQNVKQQLTELEQRLGLA